MAMKGIQDLQEGERAATMTDNSSSSMRKDRRESQRSRSRKGSNFTVGGAVLMLCCFLLGLVNMGGFAGAFILTPGSPLSARKTTAKMHNFGLLGDTNVPPSILGRSRASCAGTVLLARTRGKIANDVSQQKFSQPQWFPRESIASKKKVVYDDDIYGAADDDDDEDEVVDDYVERRGVKLLASIIEKRLEYIKTHPVTAPSDEPIENGGESIEKAELSGIALRNAQLAEGRFIDLACTAQGERVLERLFETKAAATEEDEKVVQAAVMALQSILILGTQVGVKGSPAQLQRMIAHLDSRGDQAMYLLQDLENWDTDSVRRLKYKLDRTPAIQVFSQLKWRQSTQGASEILVALGAWSKHEDLALLRSGFSVRFSAKELNAAEKASKSERDPDDLLGLRQDLRHLKVFTIDSAETSEIDDGISLEKYTDANGSEKQRIWIHIADAERWAPRDSDLFDVARRRVTSLYLPNGPVPMLPPKANDEIMSLTRGKDSNALSLGVDLLDDGSIDDSSVIVTPSLISVSYRLTYDEVDEMLEEGIGYSEEWELGALLSSATKRRQYRIDQGSSEGFVQNPIPQKEISISADTDALDGIKVEVSVKATHNAGANQTSGAMVGDAFQKFTTEVVEPVSSAFTLVTETMILAGEAIGRWKVIEDQAKEKEPEGPFKNEVRLPFRTQRKPDYTSREREKNIMLDLTENFVGGGYCHAWFCRRFLSPVKVQETCAPHAGLGLASYVQWSSPIRRYSDLLTHISVKRYLRRQKVQEHLAKGRSLGELDVREEDIGCPLPRRTSSESNEYEWDLSDMDSDIDFREGGGLVGAARMLQRQSEQYWLFEYIRRASEDDPEKKWDAMVLGWIGSADKSKKQYAIYIYELGLEHRMTSPINLESGTELKLRTSIISPRAGQLSFVRDRKSVV